MKQSRLSNELNAGSMADIAFLLLIFFLVATTIESDKGITVQLPPYEIPPPTPLPEERLLSISLNGQNDLLVEGRQVRLTDLSRIVRDQLSELFSKDVQPVVSILVDRNTKYKHYIDVHNSVKHAYRKLRHEHSIKIFQTDYNKLDNRQQKLVRDEIPMIISEAEPVSLFNEQFILSTHSQFVRLLFAMYWTLVNESNYCDVYI